MLNLSKSEFAFKIVKHLQSKKPCELTKAHELTELLGVSKPYLEQVIVGLISVKAVQAIRGCRGGYKLAEGYENVSAWDVMNRLISKQYVKSETVVDDFYDRFVLHAKSTSLLNI
jgi:Rrf2 family protein